MGPVLDFFLIVLMVVGSQIDENGAPGPIWGEVVIENPRNTQRVDFLKPFWRAFLRLFGTTVLLGRSFFDVFLERIFFASRAPFGRPRRQKGCQNGAQSDEKDGPEASCGTC